MNGLKVQFITGRQNAFFLFTHLRASVQVAVLICIKTSFKLKKSVNKKKMASGAKTTETTAALISPTYFFLFKVLKICIHEEFCLDSFIQRYALCVHLSHSSTIPFSFPHLTVSVTFFLFVSSFAYNNFK